MNRQKFILAGLTAVLLGVSGLAYITVTEGPSPQTKECAFGLRQADGTQYGLRSDDPAVLGTLSQRQVEITGVLTSPAENVKYETAGTIAVESIKPL